MVRMTSSRGASVRATVTRTSPWVEAVAAAGSGARVRPAPMPVPNVLRTMAKAWSSCVSTSPCPPDRSQRRSTWLCAVTTADDTAIWVGTPGNFSILVREGDAAPGTVGATMTTSFSNPSHQPTGINRSGRVLFQTTLANGDVSGTTNNSAWYSGTAGALELVARKGDTLPGGQVVVSVVPEGVDVVRITVTDTGCGIRPGALRELLAGERKRTIDGRNAHLGIPIARAIVEAHGGTLTAKSTMGAGSEFTIRLPRLGTA